MEGKLPIRRARSRAWRPAVEAVEARRLLSAGAPQLLEAALIGPSSRITGFSLVFNQPIDPMRAHDLNNYSVQGLRGPSGITLPLSAATMDASGKVIDVRVATPFALRAFRGVTLTANGTGPLGLTGAGGTPIAGSNGVPGGIDVVPFSVQSARAVRYQDAGNNLVTFRTFHRGLLDLLQNTGGNAEQVWLVSEKPSKSVLTGTVRPLSRFSTGATTVHQFAGLDHSQDGQLLANPAIRINLPTFCDNAIPFGA